MAKGNTGADYTIRRAQAERNVKSHITSILKSVATRIASFGQTVRYVSSKSLYRNILTSYASSALNDAEDEIREYTIEYAKASIQVLGDKDTGATTRLINGELFGKTFLDRLSNYTNRFAEDIANIMFACQVLGKTQQQTQNAVVDYMTDPYGSDLIIKANAKGAGIQTPSYGKGIYHSAYKNIVRNSQGTIAIAWGRELRNYAKRNSAIGFRVHRGSSYPCAICDDEVADGIHPITDDMPPFHLNCVCYVEIIYKEEEQ